MSIIVALLVISFLIFFHELGHFLAARYFGVFVEKFSIGFGKPLFSRVIKGTEYRFSSIPLGGYVQMKGQNDIDPKEQSFDNDSYNALHPWQRIVILFAGPFANFFLAFLLYLSVAFIGVSMLTPTIGEVQPNTPAQQAQLQSEDKIIAINGNNVQIWQDMSEYIQNSSNTLTLTVEREGEVLEQRVTPQILTTQNIFGEEVERKMIGIAPSGDFITVHMDPIEALHYGFTKTLDAATLIVQSVQKLISGVVPAKELGGVVSIVQFSAQASEAGIVALFMFTALISVNLGVLNLLPIPALDGGHIIFNLYEMVTKKAPSLQVLYSLTVFGWVLLIGLMSLGLYNDINRLIGG
ncbi:MAG: RIP metalloprotease RseP [Campylobacterota bacterium]